MMQILTRRLLPSALTMLLGVTILTVCTYAQQSSPVHAIGQFLNPDGTLRITPGFSGNLDLSGWRMIAGNSGPPRFVPDDAPRKGGAALQSISGDEFWDNRFGSGGTNGVVRAIAVSGTDVYIGGQFSVAGGVVAGNIVRWNTATQTWSTLGEQSINGVSGLSIDGGVFVNAIVVDGDNVYAGGIFNSAGDQIARGVARYSISANRWYALGVGIRAWYSYAKQVIRGGEVYSLAIMGGELYAGGVFCEVNGQKLDAALVKWDGTNWTRIGGVADDTVRSLFIAPNNDIYAGFSTSADALRKYSGGAWSSVGSINGSVYAMAPAPVPTKCYVGGNYSQAGGKNISNIAVFDVADQSFTQLGTGTDGPVHCLVSGGTDLYTGGSFTAIGDLTVNGIAKWNGAAWSSLSVGVGDTAKPVVSAIGISSDGIYAGGRFGTVGTQSARSIGRWDGLKWSPLQKQFVAGVSINGTNSAVFAAAVSGQYVYIGGDFTSAGGQPANYVARWDMQASQWQSLGTGIGGSSPFVRAIAVDGDKVYFGGIFDSAGGIPTKGIASWDQRTSTWADVAGGVSGANPYVFALLADNGVLYAAGAFTTAGSAPANRVARYSSSTGQWSALGEGVEGNVNGTYSFVTALAVGGGGVYIGGEFTKSGTTPISRVARWDGSAWSPMANGMNAPVSVLVIDGSTVYAGGEFTVAGSIPASYIAKWDGSVWSAMAGGLNRPVRAMFRGGGGELYVGGEFTVAGSPALAAGHIVKWDGTQWVPLSGSPNGPVRAIVSSGSTIFVSGSFTTTGGLRANNIATWDGKFWTALGSDPYAGLYGLVRPIALHNGDVYVGGDFPSAGGVRTGGVAKWDGRTWSRLGTGLDGSVRSMVFGGDGKLYVGGQFLNAGSVPASGVAVWDGTAWASLGTGIGGGLPYVFSLAAGGDNIYVGGSFSLAGGAGANHVAAWNTRTQAWSSLGGGLGGSSFITYVTAIAARGSDVYIGGVFPSVNTVPANNIAHWDGVSWQNMADGLNNAVYAITIDSSGTVYAGGDFTLSGSTEVNSIAKWDGTVWSTVGPGFNGSVYSLSFGKNGLYAGGGFLSSGNNALNGVSRWNNTAWTPLGSGVAGDYANGTVYAVAISRDSGLYVGGDFAAAGDKASFYFGRWFNPTLGVATPEDHSWRTSGASLIDVRPNPGNGIVHISLPGSQSGPRIILVTDLVGRVVKSIFPVPGPAEYSWDASEMPRGAYFVTVRFNSGATTVPVIIR